MTALRRSATAIALAGIVLGCSNGPTGSGSSTAASAAAAASAGPSAVAAAPAMTVPPALLGVWASDVRGTTATSGHWLLKGEPGNLSLKNPVGSEYFTLDPTLVSDHEIVVPAAADCPDQTAVMEGRYTYAITGSELVITLVSDSCGDRAGTLTVAPWTRQP